MTNGDDPISGYKIKTVESFDGMGVGVYDEKIPSALTKREYFAGLAMQGYLSAQTGEWGYQDRYRTILDPVTKFVQYDEHGEPIRELMTTAAELYAEDAVQQADALIEALNKESK